MVSLLRPMDGPLLLARVLAAGPAPAPGQVPAAAKVTNGRASSVLRALAKAPPATSAEAVPAALGALSQRRLAVPHRH